MNGWPLAMWLVCLGCLGVGVWQVVEEEQYAAVLLVWPAVAFGLFGAAYTCSPSMGVRLVSKSTTTGLIPFPHLLLLLPALLSMWLVWALKHLLVFNCKENPYDWVGPGLVVGRFPMRYPSEFPVEVRNVVDMCNEIPARASVTRGRRYACLSSLDCMLPEPKDLGDLARKVAAWDGSSYIHCANGHGRSAALCALVMVLRGNATDWRDAFKQMKLRRPGCNLQQHQMDVLDQVVLEPNSIHPYPAAESSTTSPTGVMPVTL